MQQINYSKILWIVGFAVFAAVSCWATAESLHLLLSSWPVVFCWVITVGFFVIASLGSKMIVDSLDEDLYIEGKGKRFCGGVIILLFFWLLFSMPTNTHTFFYYTVINDKVNTDISVTRGYLGQVKNNTNNEAQAQIKVNELRNNITVLLDELTAEIMNEANPGDGPKSWEIRRKIAALLEVPTIEPLSYKGTSKQDRERLCGVYRHKIIPLADKRASHIMKFILTPNTDNIKEVKRDDQNLALVKKYIDDKTIDLNDANDVEGVCEKLNTAYNTVKKNRDFINFSSKTDEAAYTADTPVTKVKRMISVVDVWKDFLAGQYAGYGFGLWVLGSILVDVAAFIFFTLAFKKKNTFNF